jgi:hypothetical protein
MKRILLISILSIISFLGFGQDRSVTFHVPDSTTNFNASLRLGTLVFDEGSNRIWKLLEKAIGTKNLSTTNASLISESGGGGSDGNGIYTGSDTLSGNTTVYMETNDLVFTGDDESLEFNAGNITLKHFESQLKLTDFGGAGLGTVSITSDNTGVSNESSIFLGLGAATMQIVVSPTLKGTIGMIDNSASDASLASFDAVGSYLGAKNAVFKSGIYNSPALGGTKMIIKTAGTAYVNQLAFNDSTAFETIINQTTPTADRSIIFPDGSGLVALMEINNSGSFGVGVVPTASLHIKGAGTTSGTTTALFENSAGTDILNILDDRKIGINNNAPNWQLHLINDGGYNSGAGIAFTNSAETAGLYMSTDGSSGISDNTVLSGWTSNSSWAGALAMKGVIDNSLDVVPTNSFQAVVEIMAYEGSAMGTSLGTVEDARILSVNNGTVNRYQVMDGGDMRMSADHSSDIYSGLQSSYGRGIPTGFEFIRGGTKNFLISAAFGGAVGNGWKTNSPTLLLQGEYDSDPTAVNTAAQFDASLQAIVTTGGASPVGRLAIEIEGLEILSLENNGNVGIGNPTPDASAVFDVVSTTKGFLMPRQTTTQMNAVSTPATGLMLFNTTENQFYFYNSTAWEELHHPHIYGAQGFSDSSITIAMTQNIFYQISNPANTLYTNGVEQGDLVFTGDSIQIKTAGDYDVNWDISFSGANTDEYHIAVFINGIKQHNAEAIRDMTGTSIGVITSHSFFSLSVDDWVCVKIKNVNNNNDATVYAGNLTIKKI